MAYDFYTVRLQGLAPMLQHNGAMSAPDNPISKAMKEITTKKKKVESDFLELADLEFKGGLYVENGRITIPTLLLEAMLVEGAKGSREGQIALSSMFVENDVVFTFSGPQTPKERLADPDCRFVVGVRVQRNRVERCRPIFRDWNIQFTVSVLRANVTEAMLKRWLENAGVYKGLGDWRPRYGRFQLTSLVKQDTQDDVPNAEAPAVDWENYASTSEAEETI